MKYNVTFSLEVDEDANFCGADRNNILLELEELIYNAVYDIDDIKILNMEIGEDK